MEFIFSFRTLKLLIFDNHQNISKNIFNILFYNNKISAYTEDLY